MLALITVGLVGCGGAGPVGRGPIATVNGTEISRSDVEELIAAEREMIETTAALAREQAGAADAQFTVEDVDRSVSEELARISGSGANTISTDAASQQVAELVQLELLRTAVEEAGGEVTDQHREDALAALESQIVQSGLSVDSVPQAMLDHHAERTAVNAALEETVPDDIGVGLGMSAEEYEQSLREIFDTNGPSYRQACLHELIFDEEEAAVDAVARLEDGDDVAAVYADLGIDDPGLAPGDCQSLPAGTLVEIVGEEAFTAEAGHVFAPEQVPGTDGGQPAYWSVITVEEVDVPEFEDVRDRIAQDFPDSTEAQLEEARNRFLDDLLRSVFADAEVTIDPRYGTWDPETGAVAAPVDPGAAPTPTGDFGDLELVEPAP